MNIADLKEIVSDWRVALYLVILVLAIISIGPHFEDGQFKTNLQFGLDLQEGSWLQLDFQSVVIGIDTDKPIDQLTADLKAKLDADVIQVAPSKLEVRKLVSKEELTKAFDSLQAGKIVTYEQGVSKNTADDVKQILETKINALGTKDAKVNTLTGMNGITRYIRVELAGVSMKQAQDVVGKQGKFEIRVQTTGNDTEHVLFGDSITSVGIPSQEPAGSGVWGVPFTLSETGANALRNASINTGAVTDPERHHLEMVLDNRTVFSAPLSPDLAAKIQRDPIRELLATTGKGTSALNDAKNLEIHLRAGALPVAVVIAGSGSVSATLGEHFKVMSILAGIVALLFLAIMIFYRYREPSIVLPMVLINASEIIILLGIARFVQQLDLSAIAGLIAVLGTGIDQLVIITDEILHEGKVPSPNLYLKRLTRALAIIVISAATVIIAMLPLAVMSLSTLRGFAIITILGVLVGVLVTRPAYGRIIMYILSK